MTQLLEEVTLSESSNDMGETSKKVGVSRHGIEIVTQGEFEERNRERIPQNTRTSTARNTRVWDKWALERNSLPLERRKTDDFTVVPEYDTLYKLCDLELCFWLSRFVHEIKKKHGSGARFSKVPITFRARKAICETANCVFWKADLLTCLSGNKKKKTVKFDDLNPLRS